MSNQSSDIEPSEKVIFERLIDRFVFAPLQGLNDASVDPEATAQRGRKRITQQFTNAKLLGQMAVAFGLKEVERRVHDLGFFSVKEDETNSDSAIVASKETSNLRSSTPIRSIDHVIANYDDLSASQVVRLLEGLSPGERTEIENYETSTRKRTTIVNKVKQLKQGTSSTS